MSKSYEFVKQWRKRTKERLIEAFGGECGVCKYNKCIEALDFHHLIPQHKDFNLSNWKKNANWDKLVLEAKKCVLLCNRCHREVHSNLLQIPDNIQKFKEEFTTYERLTLPMDKIHDECPICKKLKISRLKFCSQSCAAKNKNHGAYDKFDIKDMFVNQKMSVLKISKIIGISDVAIHKRLKKLGLK